MSNEEKLLPYFKELYNKILNKDFVIDKSGVKTVELIFPRIELNPMQPMLDFNVRKTPIKYVEKELNWYNSQSLYIDNYVDDIDIWQKVCDKDGKINSNYGYLIYNKGNGNQYENCFNHLKNNKYSRQAIMIYNRPSMHKDYNKNGMNDFTCTMYNSFLIRNNKLISIFNMRSNDAIYGFFSDFPWACKVYEKLYNDLLNIYPELKKDSIIWSSISFHVYERHFNILEEIINSLKK